MYLKGNANLTINGDEQRKVISLKLESEKKVKLC